jgi:PTH2 family peptidyl-tRNA hydrolase
MATKQVIVIRKDLRMRRGKEIAQGAHAAMAFVTRRIDTVVYPGRIYRDFTDAQKEWLATSFRKVCVRVNSETELLNIKDVAEANGLEVHLITDNGLTEFGGVPTPTCLAIGPDYDEKIDAVTGNLELY